VRGDHQNKQKYINVGEGFIGHQGGRTKYCMNSNKLYHGGSGAKSQNSESQGRPIEGYAVFPNLKY